MGLCGKETKQLEINFDGNLVFDLMAYCPYQISKLSPQVHACDLHEGQWGNVGSVISWTAKVDDETVFAKMKMVTKDEEKKIIQFELIEGQLLEAYRSCLITFQSSNNSIIASVEFEKINECMPNPITAYLNAFEKLVRDLETNYQVIPRIVTN